MYLQDTHSWMIGGRDDVAGVWRSGTGASFFYGKGFDPDKVLWKGVVREHKRVVRVLCRSAGTYLSAVPCWKVLQYGFFSPLLMTPRWLPWLGTLASAKGGPVSSEMLHHGLLHIREILARPQGYGTRTRKCRGMQSREGDATVC